jgi:thiol-disulfide isomerase/thioredoxin
VVDRRRLRLASLTLAATVVAGVGYVAASSGGDEAGTSADVVLDGNANRTPPSLAVNENLDGSPLPEVDVETIDGATVALASLIERPTVINLWNTTCLPCKKELRDFADIDADIADDQISFIGINTFDDDLGADFAAERGVTYALYGSRDGSVTAATGIATLPVTLFVDSNGTIVHQSGVLDAATLRDLIEEHLR